MLFESGVTLLIVATVALVISTAMLVERLRDAHADVFERLDRPSPFYFVGLQWMMSGKFADFTWSAEGTKFGDTRRLVWSVRASTTLIFFAMLLLAAYQVR